MSSGVCGLRAGAITRRARVVAHCARFLGHFFVAHKEVAEETHGNIGGINHRRNE